MKLRDVPFSLFKTETEGKKIICVGGGKIIEDFFSIMEKDVTDRVVAIADNHKKGQSQTYYDRVYNVIGMDQLESLLGDNTAVLITTMYCNDIINQLEADLGKKEFDCYIYTLLSLRVGEYEFPKSNSSNNRIPKKIHWIWFGKSDLPLFNRKCIDSWKRYNPDYEIICWTEDNYDIKKCEYMYEAYKNKKWGFTVDYARLDIIYNEGGIYLDTDVEVVKSFDDLLRYEAFFGFQRNFKINLGHGFGSMSHNKLIGKLRDYYYDIQFHTSCLRNMISPDIQTNCLIEDGLKCNNVVQMLDGAAVFPSDVFDPKGSPIWEPCISMRTHGIHHYDESWVDKEDGKKQLEKYRQIGLYR